MKLHQLLILYTWEIRRVLSSLDEVLQEAQTMCAEYPNMMITTHANESHYVNYPIEDSNNCVKFKFWELSEKGTHKICASMTVYDKENFDRLGSAIRDRRTVDRALGP